MSLAGRRIGGARHRRGQRPACRRRAGRLGVVLRDRGLVLRAGAAGGGRRRRLSRREHLEFLASAASTWRASSAPRARPSAGAGATPPISAIAPRSTRSSTCSPTSSPSCPRAGATREFLFLGNIHPGAPARGARAGGEAAPGGDGHDELLDRGRAAGAGDACSAKVDLLVINDEEARQLSREHNLRARRGRSARWGPRRSSSSAASRARSSSTSTACSRRRRYPLEEVVDPTGAGDTFAGGFMGYLARVRRRGAAGGAAGHVLRLGHGSLLRRGLFARSVAWVDGWRDRGAL